MKHYFKHMALKYNLNTTKDLKHYSKQKEKLIKQQERLEFLTECRKYGLIPTHTEHHTTKISDTFTSNTIKYKLKKLEQDFHNKLLQLEIKQTHITIKNIKQQLIQQEQSLKRTIESGDYDEFIKRQLHQKNKLAEQIKTTHKNKTNALKIKTLDKFNITFNDNWVINETDIELPIESQWILSLGKKFTLPTTNKNVSYIQLIADMEQYIQTLEDDKDKDNIRTNLTKNILNYKRNRKTSALEKFILQTYKTTEKIIKDNKDRILITTADKGNKTVILYKTEYIQKMTKLLEDKDTYRKIRSDPTTTIQNTNNNIVNKLFKQGHIDYKQKLQLYNTSSIAPRLYGLPKVHKENIPMRPIVSSTNVPCYKMAKHIGDILKNIISTELNIKNSFQLKSKLEKIRIENNDILVSFDVISLFTNISTHLAIDIIMTQWEHLKKHTNIPRNKFLEMLKFCLKDNNYFSFDHNIYIQSFGMPMGNPLSPTIADIVLDHIIQKTITNLEERGIHIRFLTKYVDDIFAIIDKQSLDPILKELNNQNKKLKFTVETEENNSIPFLELKIHKLNNKLIFDWYSKPTASGRIINYNSSQPQKTKINTAYNLICKVIDISDEQFINKNTKILQQILQQNDYPFATINSLINKKLNSKNNNKNNTTTSNIDKKYISIPFVNHLTDNNSLRKILPESNIIIAHKSNTTLMHLFKSAKDKVDKTKICNVVYEIPCKGTENQKCSKIYIGTTKRSLDVRLKEHENDIKKEKSTTGIAQHMLNHGHSPDFVKTRVLDIENKHNKRLTLESLRIRQNEHITMNNKEDVDNISTTYDLVLKASRKC